MTKAWEQRQKQMEEVKQYVEELGKENPKVADIMYAATHYRNGEIPNENAIKVTADFSGYKEAQERAIPKFKYFTMMITELRKILDEEIKPLVNN